MYGKTGTAERNGQVEQAWYMCYIADPKRPIVIAVTVEQGGFGDQAAAPVARLMASAVVRKPRSSSQAPTPTSNPTPPLSPIQAPQQTAWSRPGRYAAAAGPAADTGGPRPGDLLDRDAAQRHQEPDCGDPATTSDRQAIYLVVGLVLMVLVSRFDYSLLRQTRNAIYALLIFSILAVLGLGHAANGSQRAISLPFFSFQASELGKVLLIVALSAFIVDRSRALHELDTTARVMAAALVPAMLVIAQPDLGSGMVYIVIAFTLLFVAGTSWRHLVGLAAVGGVDYARAGGRAGGRRAPAQALSGAAPDGVPAPHLELAGNQG